MRVIRVSVITPTYNSARYIDECVANVAAQQVAGLEHIVMDGGSTDGTAARLQALANVHPHLRFVSEKDRGQSDAMNKALQLASGEVIAILNVDDYYEPGAIAEALMLLDRSPELDMVVGACRAVDADGTTLYWNRPKELRPEALMLGWAYYEFPCNPSAYFYRKKVHDIVGPFDVQDHYSMDFKFILHCAFATRMAFFDRHWGNYLMVPGTKTFEDRPNGPARIKTITARFAPRLTPGQRVNMQLLKARMHLKWTYWEAKRLLRNG